jgi:hypothetical protein
VNDFKGMSNPPRLDAGIALTAGLLVRGGLRAGFELEGVLALFVAVADFSSERSSFLENIFENGFTNAGFLLESFSVAASSLWLKPVEDERKNEKQAIANR